MPTPTPIGTDFDTFPESQLGEAPAAIEVALEPGDAVQNEPEAED